MKKAFIIILIILVVVLGIYVLAPKEEPKPEKNKINETNNKIEDQIINNTLISNISLTNKNSKTIFSAKITNLTSNEQNYKNLQITVTDKNNKTLTTLISYFGEKLNPEETKIVTAETSKEIKNIDTIEFILN